MHLFENKDLGALGQFATIRVQLIDCLLFGYAWKLAVGQFSRKAASETSFVNENSLPLEVAGR